jgi:hypothetical protein
MKFLFWPRGHNPSGAQLSMKNDSRSADQKLPQLSQLKNFIIALATSPIMKPRPAPSQMNPVHTHRPSSLRVTVVHNYPATWFKVIKEVEGEEVHIVPPGLGLHVRVVRCWTICCRNMLLPTSLLSNIITGEGKNLCDLSPRVYYTDWEIAACQRS